MLGAMAMATNGEATPDTFILDRETGKTALVGIPEYGTTTSMVYDLDGTLWLTVSYYLLAVRKAGTPEQEMIEYRSPTWESNYDALWKIIRTANGEKRHAGLASHGLG